MASLLAQRGSDTLFRTAYTRDSLSRITQLIERLNGVTDTTGFSYDSVGRLKAVTRNGSLAASYTYDLNGNRATKVTSAGTQTATVDDQDRLLAYGNASFHYTANGEVRRKIVGTDTTVYTYDALGNLTQVELPDGTAIGYLIDAQNRRIGKTVNGTLTTAWLYQGQLTPVAELDGAGNVVSRFVYATGVNVPDYLVKPGAGGDSTYRLLRDHLGSVRLVVNVASGSVVQRVRYDEFGIETENTNPGWQPFGYAGGLTDPQTGLIRFGARDYDPQAGRWTAKDPIGFAGGTTSLYTYAGNDPVGVIDPSGLVAETILDVASTAFSLRDFICDPSFANGAWLALDAVGLLIPFVPSFGIIRHGAKIAGKIPNPRAAAAPARARLVQDVAVNPVAPPALPTSGRSIGRPTHNQRAQEIISNLPADASDIRVNQQQVNAAGQRIGVNRPDIQYTSGGQRHYIEIEGRGNPRGAAHESRIRANDPQAGSVLTIIQP